MKTLCFLRTSTQTTHKYTETHRTWGRIVLGLTATLLMALSLTTGAQAQAYAEKTLHTFTGSGDGLIPDGDLLNVNGILYGTTGVGGTNGYGTIFSIKPDGTGYQTLYSFGSSSPSDGTNPSAGLVLLNGILYGTTRSSKDTHYGSVYSFDPATGIEKVVCSFDGSAGGNPATDLISVNGLLYGTTSTMGLYEHGAIFSVDPATSTLNTLYSFAGGSDGDLSYGTLVNVNGILYGTTLAGGTDNDGIVYSYDLSSGKEKVLHTFTGTTTDGNGCRSGLLNVNGVLYGTTLTGGSNDSGTVFSLNTDGTGFHVVYSFIGSGGDGLRPNAGLIDDSGILYGTTYEGGNANNGTVFSLNPTTGKETILYRFSARDMNYVNADGAEPYAALININGTLYGTAEDGGMDSGGTIFSLTPVSPPTAKNDTYTPKYETPYTVAAPGVLANDDNGGSTPLTAKLITNVTHGTLTFKSDGSFTYTAAAGFIGNDTFTYQAINPIGTSNTATVTLTVQPTAPIAIDHYVRVLPNTTLIDHAPGVLGNVDNGGSSPMTASLVTNVTHGTLSLKSYGSFTYTPTTGFSGADSFTYQAVNSIGKSNIATVYLAVQKTPPVAITHYVRVHYNITLTDPAPGVLGGVDNGGSSPMTAVLVANVTHGTLSLKSDGSFVYTPTTGFKGVDSFTYQAVNAIGKSNIATTYLTVQ